MKRITALIIVVIMAFALCACGSTSKVEPAASAAPAAPTTNEPIVTESGYEDLKIIIAHSAAEKTEIDAFWLKVEELLEERSGGAIQADVFPNMQLGGDGELIDAISQGSVQMASCSIAPLCNISSALYALEPPFAFSDKSSAYEFYDSDFVQEAIDTLLPANIKGVACVENGFRLLTCNKKITTPEQCKNLVIRTMENEIHMATWRAFGANPTPMTFSEVYTALEQGTVDAQENPAGVISGSRLYEVQDYVIRTNHFYANYIAMIDNSWFESLPAVTQELILECVEDAKLYSREYAVEMQDSYISNISTGAEVVDITEDERTLFIEAVEKAGIYDLIREKAGGDWADRAYKLMGLEV